MCVVDLILRLWGEIINKNCYDMSIAKFLMNCVDRCLSVLIVRVMLPGCRMTQKGVCTLKITTAARFSCSNRCGRLLHSAPCIITSKLIVNVCSGPDPSFVGRNLFYIIIRKRRLVFFCSFILNKHVCETIVSIGACVCNTRIIDKQTIEHKPSERIMKSSERIMKPSDRIIYISFVHVFYWKNAKIKREPKDRCVISEFAV